MSNRRAKKKNAKRVSNSRDERKWGQGDLQWEKKTSSRVAYFQSQRIKRYVNYVKLLPHTWRHKNKQTTKTRVEGAFQVKYSLPFLFFSSSNGNKSMCFENDCISTSFCPCYAIDSTLAFVNAHLKKKKRKRKRRDNKKKKRQTKRVLSFSKKLKDGYSTLPLISVLCLLLHLRISSWLSTSVRSSHSSTTCRKPRRNKGMRFDGVKRHKVRKKKGEKRWRIHFKEEL